MSFKVSDDDASMDFYRRCQRDPHVRLLEVRPFANREDRRQLARAYLSRYLKQLDDRDLEMLIKSVGAGNPLYLKIVLSELRVFGAFAGLHDQVRHAFGHSPVSAFEALLERLETDPAHTDLDPREVVPLLFGLIAHARRGLSVAEVADMIVRRYPWPDGAEATNEQLARRVQQASDAVHLYFRQLRPFLARREGRHDFFYESFRTAVRNRYGTSTTWRSAQRPAETWHHLLAEYFSDQDLYRPRVDGGRELEPNVRKLDELPWQQTQGKQWSALRATLCNIEFIEAKCRAGMTYSLVEDYANAERDGSLQSNGDHRTDDPVWERLRLFEHFVSTHSNVFARDGDQVVPFGHNYASTGVIVEQADRCLRRRGPRYYPWIELLDRPVLSKRPATLRVLEGHRGDVTSVALSADAGTVVSGSKDGTIRIWNAESGVAIRTIFAHGGGGINDLAITPDGLVLATAGAGGTVRTWDSRNGVRRCNLTGHDGEVLSVALTADGRYAVSGGRDGSVMVWDLASETRVHEMRGHFGPVNCVDVGSHGRIAVSGGWDCTIRIWDIEAGEPVDCLEGHTVSVQGVSVDSAATVIASSSGIPPGPTGTAPAGIDESDVRFWERRCCRHVGHAHGIGDRGGQNLGVLGSVVYDVAMSSDARVAVSGAYDRTVCVWDVSEGRLLRLFTGHSDSVLSAAVDRTGTRGATGAKDGTIRVWRLDGETPPLLPARRRIGTVGRGKRTSLYEKASLVFGNRRIQNTILIPGVSLFLGPVLSSMSQSRIITPLWSLDLPPQAAALYWVVALASTIYFIRWRRELRADPYVAKSPFFPKFLRRVVSSLLLPLLPFFRVVNCPSCGYPLCGRRYLFHCAHCGWRDG